MTDRQKWQEIVDKVEAIKESQPLAYQVWQSIFATIKPQLEQALQASDQDGSKQQEKA